MRPRSSRCAASCRTCKPFSWSAPRASTGTRHRRPRCQARRSPSRRCLASRARQPARACSSSRSPPTIPSPSSTRAARPASPRQRCSRCAASKRCRARAPPCAWAGALGAGSRPEDGEELLAETVGRPASEVEVAIVDEERKRLAVGAVGEVAVRSPAVMVGYWRRPEETAEVLDRDGWFYTGDLGTLDERGYLRLRGRKKEMYIRGGYNVYPVEVEARLARHPAVAQAAVVGVPDPVLGEKGLAVVVLRE